MTRSERREWCGHRAGEGASVPAPPCEPGEWYREGSGHALAERNPEPRIRPSCGRGHGQGSRVCCRISPCRRGLVALWPRLGISGKLFPPGPCFPNNIGVKASQHPCPHPQSNATAPDMNVHHSSAQLPGQCTLIFYASCGPVCVVHTEEGPVVLDDKRSLSPVCLWAGAAPGALPSPRPLGQVTTLSLGPHPSRHSPHHSQDTAQGLQRLGSRLFL